MKDTIKFALNCLMMYGAAVIIALLFSSLVASDNTFFSVLGIIATLLVLVVLAFFEGGSRGEADSAFEKRLQDREKERGEAPTPAERERFYYPWKGAVASLLSVSPLILLSIFMLFYPVPAAEDAVFIGTVIIRALLWPFLGILSHFSVQQTWIYLPLSLVFPAVVSVGYAMGPKRFSKLLRQMHDNEERRRRRRKKKAPIR